VKFIDPNFADSFGKLVVTKRVASTDEEQGAGRDGLQSKVHPIDIIIEEANRNKSVAQLEAVKTNTETALADLFRCEL